MRTQHLGWLVFLSLLLSFGGAHAAVSSDVEVGEKDKEEASDEAKSKDAGGSNEEEASGSSEGSEAPSGDEREGSDQDDDDAPPLKSLGKPAMPGMDMDILYPSEGVAGQAQMGSSFTQIGEDYFLTLDLSMVLAGANWSIAPRVPLRFRVLDEEPDNDGVFRDEDWDEVSDFLRLIAFAEYRTDDQSFQIRFGEFTGASLGHGTMISRYYNSLDINHHQAGITSHLDLGIAGGEVLLDNIFDPELVALRPFVRPFSTLASLPDMFRGLKLGVSLGADFRAPLSLQKQANGAVMRDDALSPLVSESEAIPLLGFDLELPVVMNDTFQFVPYFDMNSVALAGYGIHFGTFITFRFSSVAEWRIRAEYRWSGAGYDPTYVNGHYEVERLSYHGAQTKLSWLRADLPSSRTGVQVQSELSLLGIIRLLALFSHDEGAPGQPASNDLVARLVVPEMGPVSMSAYFAKLGFTNAEDLADLSGAVLVGSARWSATDYFYIEARATKEWGLDPNSNDYDTGWDFDVGTGFLLNI